MKILNLSILCTALLPTVSFANFIDDSQVSVTARNFYLDRNLTDPAVTQPAQKEWVQGFILNAKSGYTEGVVGLGLDLYAGVGFKLWGDKEHSLGTGLLPVDMSTLEPEDSYGEIGWTAKAKVAQTEIKVGTLFPFTPVLVGSPARLMPQTYRGVSIESKDVENFKLEAGFVDRVNHRDSTNYEKIKLSAANKKYPSVETTGLHYVGGYYYLQPQTAISLFHANLHDVYNQYTVSVKNTHRFDDTYNLSTDFRYFRTVDEGVAKAGHIDNHHGNLVLALGVNNHKFAVGYIHNAGDTGFPYLSGGEANTYMDAWATDFLNPKEKAYTVRYDYDFKNEIPGLKFMTRFTQGKDIELVNLVGDQRKLEERILGVELSYQLQTTQLKGLNIRLRHEDYRNDFGPTATFRTAKEQRVNIDYTWKFK